MDTLRRLVTVTVVSLLSETAPVQRLGFTVFTNGRSGIDQGGKLKQVAVDTVSRHLKTTRPQWAVKVADLAPPGTGGGRTADRNAARLAELAGRLDVDQVFFLEDSNSQNFPGQGVGLAFRTAGSATGPVMVHAYVTLVVLDRNGKRIVARGAIKNNPQQVPIGELGLRPDLSNLEDAAVRDKVSRALQRRLEGAVDEAMTRAGY